MEWMMSNKKGFGWYSLPEEVRRKLLNLSKSFYTLKDQGQWIPPGLGGYEPEVIIILRMRNTLSYDVFIPAIIKLMGDGVLTTIFPIGMKTVDVAFHQFEPGNRFDENAYVRAGIERKGEEKEV